MERKSEDIPLLVAQEGLLNGQRWELRNRLIIGRDASCDIVVADRQVSRRHARLTPTPKGILLEDLGSKNGTNRNGEPLSDSVILMDGDSIQIALAQTFLYLSSDDRGQRGHRRDLHPAGLLHRWGVEPVLLHGALHPLDHHSGGRGYLGIMFVTMLRRVLVEDAELPVPESIAASEIHKSGQAGVQNSRYLFAGMGIGAFFNTLVEFKFLAAGWQKVVSLAKGSLLLRAPGMNPAYFGVGYIIGPRLGALNFSGGVLAWGLLTPIIAYFIHRPRGCPPRPPPGRRGRGFPGDTRTRPP